jgi:Dehydrogenases with different specificities (related to short-chain alcohol dehydrogenases)
MDVILQDKCDINFIYDDYDEVPAGLWDCRTENLSLVAEAFKKTKQTFGTIDIVINNAGIVGEDKWETAVEVNVVRNKNIVFQTARNACRYD